MKSSEDIIRILMDEVICIQNNFKKFKQIIPRFEDLSENLVLLLLRLKLHGNMKVTEISELFALTPGAVTNMCDKLEELQYVERVRLKDDRRVVRVSLTKKGEERVEAIFAKFNHDELEKTLTILKEINILFSRIEE